MNGKQKPDVELSRYLVVLLHLERKLPNAPILLERLRAGIEHAQNQLEHFDIIHANVLAGLARHLCGNHQYTETAASW